MIFNPVYGGASTPNLGTKTITINGTYNASSDGLDGYSQVTANVPNPSTGTLNVTENGTYNVTQYASVNVNVRTVLPIIDCVATFDLRNFVDTIVIEVNAEEDVT